MADTSYTFRMPTRKAHNMDNIRRTTRTTTTVTYTVDQLVDMAINALMSSGDGFPGQPNDAEVTVRVMGTPNWSTSGGDFEVAYDPTAGHKTRMSRDRIACAIAIDFVT